MASLNKVILIGNLGADPEVRFTPNGSAVANFRIATTDTWTDKSGQRQERTEWHRIVVWGRQAEPCGQYLKKGRSAYIEGRLQSKEWNDKEGQKRTSVEVVADRVLFLGSRNEGAGSEYSAGSAGGGGEYGGGAPASGTGGDYGGGGRGSYAPRGGGYPSPAAPVGAIGGPGGGHDESPPLDDSDIPF